MNDVKIIHDVIIHKNGYSVLKNPVQGQKNPYFWQKGWKNNFET